MIPPDADEAQSPELQPAPGIQQILERARQKQEQTAHAYLGQNHLLAVLLENYAPMARDLVRGLDTVTLLADIRHRLGQGELGVPVETASLLAYAGERTRARGKTLISERDLAAALLSAAGYRVPVEDAGGAVVGTVGPAFPAFQAAVNTGSSATASPRPRFPVLERYGQDLTEAALGGKLAPLVGREAEVQMVMETLCRRITRNPVLVGPAGVGKTAIVEGLAARIAGGAVPPPLQGTRLFALLPSAITAGASQYGELEKRLEAILHEANNPAVLLFIDEVHAIVGAGGRPGSNDMATLLKPALARGEIACIAATTDDEYRRFIEQDPALERRFQPIRINELGAEATLEILRSLRTISAEARGVEVADEALRYLIEVADRYLRNRHFPAKAVDLFEQCVAYAIAQGRQEIRAGDADTVVRRLIGMPALPRERLNSLRARLADSLAAAAALSEEGREGLVNRLQVSLEGFDLRPERPNATLLLAGRAVSHAAALARELADGLYGSPDRIITIDFARFTEAHQISMLLGSPPGYVGYSERLPLHMLEQTPWCVLLCENVDQCHEGVRSVLAQALETGVFTDAAGKHLYISDAIVVLTARGLGPDGSERSRRSGFMQMARRSRDREPEGAGTDPALLRAEAERVLGAELADHCDFICVEAEPEAGAAARLAVEQTLLRPIAARYAREGLILTWDPAVVDYLLSREPGQTSPRDQERILDRHIAPLLLPYRGTPGAQHRERYLLLRLEQNTLEVAEVAEVAESQEGPAL